MNESQKNRGGRKEVLTLDLARKIVTLIERMPDADIPVSWDSIELHVKRKFGQHLKRNVLSSKEWGGRKLIYEAYTDAIAIQRRLKTQNSPKYASSSRAVLLNVISQLESKVLGLKDELEKARAARLTELDLFRVTRMDLRRMVDDAHQGKGHDFL